MRILNRSIPVFLLCAVACSSALHAQVFEDDAVLLATPGAFLGDYQITIGGQTDPFAGSLTARLFGFGIEDEGNDTYQFNGITLGDPTALFLANSGDVIGAQFITENPIFASNFGPFPPSDLTLAVGESQYFAYYYDGLNFDFSEFPDFVSSDDNFGWFRLDRQADGWLSITSGATAAGAEITVGTTESFAIPEPSGFALLIFSGIVASVRRQKQV